MDQNAQQPQPAVNPQLVASQVPPAVRKISSLPKILLSLLGVIIVLGLIGGSYYLGTQKNATTISNGKTAIVPTTSVTVASTSVATPTPDATANWQTYANTFFNITLKYPRDWKVIDQKSQTVFNQSENKNMRTDDITLGLKDQSVTLGMEFTENENFKSSEDFLNFPTPIKDSEKIQVAGIPGRFYTSFNEGPMPARGYWTYLSFFKSGMEYNMYLISPSGSQEELMRTITSTIRFIN